MNCQSEAWASSSSRAACASTGRAPRAARAAGALPRAALPLLRGRDARQQRREMTAMLTHPAERRGGLVSPLRSEIHVGAGHAPQLEPAGPADLVELEVPLVARVAMVAAPDL